MFSSCSLRATNLINWGLDPSSLNTAWDLSDAERDGKLILGPGFAFWCLFCEFFWGFTRGRALDRGKTIGRKDNPDLLNLRTYHEFFCFIHLITCATRGAVVPQSLPPQLLDCLMNLEPLEILAAEREESRSRSQSPGPDFLPKTPPPEPPDLAEVHFCGGFYFKIWSSVSWSRWVITGYNIVFCYMSMFPWISTLQICQGHKDFHPSLPLMISPWPLVPRPTASPPSALRRCRARATVSASVPLEEMALGPLIPPMSPLGSNPRSLGWRRWCFRFWESPFWGRKLCSRLLNWKGFKLPTRSNTWVWAGVPAFQKMMPTVGSCPFLLANHGGGCLTPRWSKTLEYFLLVLLDN